MVNPAPPLAIRPVRAFADNYIWLIDSPRTPGRVVAVDPGEAAPVLAELRLRGSSLAAILLTHHHADHIGGVAELLQHGAVPVIGPDDDRIPVKTRTVKDGETCELAELGLVFETLEVPGHTLSHIAFRGPGVLLSGDTLFSAGCGRLFEGSPSQMYSSLSRLRALPDDTRLFCGHEYTAANLRFALAVEPDNADTLRYRDAVERLRPSNAGVAASALPPSLPSTVGLENRVNPFLRCDNAGVKAAAEAHAGRSLATPTEVFATLRAWKDQFR